MENAKLFVGSLSPYTDDASLQRYFTKWGNVISAKAAIDTVTCKCVGFGFVTYEKRADMEKTFNPTIHHVLDGWMITLREAQVGEEEYVNKSNTTDMARICTKKQFVQNGKLLSEPTDDGTYMRKRENARLFIGNLSPYTDDCSFQQYFEQWGPVTHATVVTDQNTHLSQRFGFITYERRFSMKQCLANPTHELDGWHIKPFDASEEASGGRWMQLDAASTHEHIQEFIADYAKVFSVRLVPDAKFDQSGRSQDHWFIEFEDVWTRNSVVCRRDKIRWDSEAKGFGVWNVCKALYNAH